MAGSATGDLWIMSGASDRRRHPPTVLSYWTLPRPRVSPFSAALRK
jgi:hypothetical protein